MKTEPIFTKWFEKVREIPGMRFTRRTPRGMEAYTWEHKSGKGEVQFYWCHLGKEKRYAVTFLSDECGSLWISKEPILENKDGPEQEWFVGQKAPALPNPLDLLLGVSMRSWRQTLSCGSGCTTTGSIRSRSWPCASSGRLSVSGCPTGSGRTGIGIWWSVPPPGPASPATGKRFPSQVSGRFGSGGQMNELDLLLVPTEEALSILYSAIKDGTRGWRAVAKRVMSIRPELREAVWDTLLRDGSGCRYTRSRSHNHKLALLLGWDTSSDQGYVYISRSGICQP